MNKWEALQAFWESFGWSAYDQNSVDTGSLAPSLPYITYEAQTGAIGQVLTLTASLWDRSTSWKSVSDKADEIAEEIGYACKIAEIDGGYLYITKGQPFAQRMSDPEDSEIKRIYIILNAEFLTAY
jgi:hypothetical protein